jgi:hypothetical protein
MSLPCYYAQSLRAKGLCRQRLRGLRAVGSGDGPWVECWNLAMEDQHIRAYTEKDWATVADSDVSPSDVPLISSMGFAKQVVK